VLDSLLMRHPSLEREARFQQLSTTPKKCMVPPKLPH